MYRYPSINQVYILHTIISEGVQVAVGKIGSAPLHTYSIIEGVLAAVRTKSGLQYYTPIVEGVQAAVMKVASLTSKVKTQTRWHMHTACSSSIESECCEKTMNCTSETPIFGNSYIPLSVCLSPRRQSLPPSLCTTLAANSCVRRGWCITRPLPNLESYLQESGGIPWSRLSRSATPMTCSVWSLDTLMCHARYWWMSREPMVWN